MREAAVQGIIWRTEEKEMTLDGETVLQYRLQWPQIEGRGFGVRRLNRGYDRMAGEWRGRWEREAYCLACLQLAECRSQARPFRLWQGGLEGEVTVWEENFLGLKLWAWEEHGDGRKCRVCWGDVWNVREGAPIPLREILSRTRRWKKALCRQLIQQGEQMQKAGTCFWDPNWQTNLGKQLDVSDYCLYGDRVEFPFPQCTLAPAVEGIPILWVPRPGGTEEN